MQLKELYNKIISFINEIDAHPSSQTVLRELSYVSYSIRELLLNSEVGYTFKIDSLLNSVDKYSDISFTPREFIYIVNVLETGICVYGAGGEDEGSRYSRVWKFTDDSNKLTLYISFDGWHVSYFGVRFDSTKLVEPYQEVITKFKEVPIE